MNSNDWSAQPQCVFSKNDTLIKISEENSSTIFIQNKEKSDYILIDYDNCFFKKRKPGVKAADFILDSYKYKHLVIIELKSSSSLERGIEQLEATLLQLVQLAKPKSALLVHKKISPRTSTSLNTKIRLFEKKTKCRLIRALDNDKLNFSVLL